MRFSRLVSGLVGAVVTIGLVFAAGATGLVGGIPLVAPMAAATSAKAPGGASEGIQVHGAWTIEVRNPDGTVASKTEFENSLEPAGGALLPAILARKSSVGYWYVVLSSSTGTQPCNSPSSQFACWIAESGDTGTGPQIFQTLTVGTSGTGSAIKFSLAGTATVANATSITDVETLQQSCANTTAPSTPCASSGGIPFTSKTLAAPISVEPGQQVLVKVDISFQ